MWRESLDRLIGPLVDFPVKNILMYAPALTPQQILYSIIIFLWTVYLWETYLLFRQYQVMKKNKSVPPELAGVMDQVTYNKSRLYNLDKSKFQLVSSLWEQFLQTFILLFGGLPLLWGLSGRITAHFGYGKEHEITHTAVFTLLGSLINFIIDMPWSYYSTFVIEERHGFNKETIGFFFKDRIKKFTVLQALLLPILACIVHIVKIGGDYFFITLWVFCVILSLILMTVYADYIAPLFDKFTPLPEGELKSRIESLAKSIDFPLKKLFIVEGSKRSAHSNAYFYGFYKNKRIVLFDTLLQDYTPADKKNEENSKKENEKSIEKENNSEKEAGHQKSGCNNDEIVAVLAHELGHWKLNHVMKNLIISQVNLFLCFAVFSLLYKNEVLFTAFGFPVNANEKPAMDKPVIIGFLVIFQYVFLPYHEVLNFLMTMLSRRFEFQADAFAKLLNRAADLRSALVKLNHDNLGFPVHDWLYSTWHHSHPPILQRIRALGKID